MPTASVEIMPSSSRVFLEQQHRLRGLVSEFKSKKFVKNRTIPSARRFRAGLSSLFLDVRTLLSREDYRPYLEWANDLIITQLSELSRVAIGYDNLSGLYGEAPIVPLEVELAWVSERLRIYADHIETYLAAKMEIERLAIEGKYALAVDGVELVQKVFGVSLWSVQLRLALEQQSGGLERQKRYSAEVRKVYQRGLLGFVTYYTSVRNEDRTTITKFLDDIEVRIGSHPYYDEGTKTYARYRLKNEISSIPSDLADILRVEQNHGTIDLYETFIATLQQLARSRGSHDLDLAILHSIRGTTVRDFRLAKIEHLLDPNAQIALPLRRTDVSDRVIGGDLKEAMTLWRTYRRADAQTDSWVLIYIGFALAHAPRPRSTVIARPTTVSRLIAQILRNQDSSIDALAQTLKLALNYKTLTFGGALFDFLALIKRSKPDEPWQPWHISLNCFSIGVEDFDWNSICMLRDRKEMQLQTNQVWTEGREPGGDTATPVALLIRAAGMISRGELSEAALALGLQKDSLPQPLRSLRSLLLLHIFHARGQRQNVIELLADEGSKSRAHRQLLPIVGSLSNYTWPDFKLSEAPLAAPIALHLLWSQHETSVTASAMRFAAGSALKRLHGQRPSQLVDNENRFPSHELIYFLRYVCVPNILDLSRLFSGTRDLMLERQAVCRVLEEIDPENSSLYRDEIVLIANDLAVDEGTWIVDSTRIHVDGEALTRWAIRELSEDYERYHDLVDVDVPSQQSFEDVMREIVEGNTQRLSFSPTNESDAILVSIISRIGEEFLLNATFGLDFFLSKRVRHQSFIGLIRGPLEFAQLITTRESELGEYRPNDFWINRFVRMDSAARALIDGALKHFAARFDETLNKAKDTYFHVKSANRPHGMIILTISERLLALTRTIAALEQDFRDYVPLAITILWAALAPALANIRRLISEEIKSEIISEFDRVRRAVRQIAESDPTFLEFDAAMGRGSTEVQIKLDEAAQWFVHARTAAAQQNFTLAQILKISLEAALKTQRGYTPDINQRSSGDLRLSADNLVFVHDVLFVGLGNVHKHSGLRTPKIEVSAIWKDAESSLAIEVISDCKPGNRAEKARQSDIIREMIAGGSYSGRNRTEGGSGFAKLATAVGQSERARLEFGFTLEGRFRLYVEYAVIIPGRNDDE